MISLEKLNRSEALRYLGGAKTAPDEKMLALLDDCEEQIISRARPKYLYRELELPNDELVSGKDIARHLEGCTKAVIMCATLGTDIDKLIRVTQISAALSRISHDLPIQPRLRRLSHTNAKILHQ